MPRRPEKSGLPPPMEMMCLSALWKLGEGTVHDVLYALAPRQKLAYTTVMTLLERLVKRNHLSRRKVGRSFRYAPIEDPGRIRKAAVEELTAVYFGGSREALRVWLDGTTEETALPPSTPEPIDTTLL